jgi:hypothetical protein
MEPVRLEPWTKEGREAVARTLAETSFADVEQGLTVVNRAALPAAR